MSIIHEAIFPLLPEPNTEFGMSKLQEVKFLKNLQWSRTWQHAALQYIAKACRKVLQCQVPLIVLSKYLSLQFKVLVIIYKLF